VKEGRFRLDIRIIRYEGCEALEHIAQRSFVCPLSVSVQGQVGWGFEEPGVVEGVSAHGRRLELDGLEGPFQPKLFYDSVIQSRDPEHESECSEVPVELWHHAQVICVNMISGVLLSYSFMSLCLTVLHLHYL